MVFSRGFVSPYSIMVFALVLGAVAPYAAEATQPKPLRRIAVAPLRSVNNDVDTQWLGLGLGKAVKIHLDVVPGLNVIGPCDLAHHLDLAKITNDGLDSNATARKVGEFARAERVLVGSYIFGEDDLVLNATVVNTATGMILASKKMQVAMVYDAPVALAKLVIESYSKKVIAEVGKSRVVPAGKGEQLSLNDEAKQLLAFVGTDKEEAFAAWCQGAVLGDQVGLQIRFLRKAITVDPNYGFARCHLAIHLSGIAGGREEAAKHMVKAFELLPKHPWPRRMRFAMGNSPAEDKVDAEWLLKRDPNYLWGLIGLGQVYCSLGDMNAAEKVARQLAKLDPHDSASYILLARIYAKRKDYAAAIKVLSRGLGRVAPIGAAQLYGLRGGNALDMGQIDKAADDFERGITVDPMYAWNYVGRAELDIPGNTDAKRIADLAKAIELGARTAGVYKERGWYLYYTGAYEAAVADFDKAIGLDPTLVSAWLGRGTVRADMGRFDEAIRDITAGIELDPRNADAFDYRARLHVEIGDQAKALADFNQAIGLDATHESALRGRGILYTNAERYGDAIKDFSTAIEVNPTNALAWADRALAYVTAGEASKAIADANKAVELDANDPRFLFLRGCAFSNAGREEDAIKDASRSIELRPNNGSVYHFRGRVYEKIGQTDKAAADLEKARSLGYEVDQDDIDALRKGDEKP